MKLVGDEMRLQRGWILEFYRQYNVMNDESLIAIKLSFLLGIHENPHSSFYPNILKI